MTLVVEIVLDGPPAAIRGLVRDMVGFVALEHADGRHVQVKLRATKFRAPKSPPMPVSRVLEIAAEAVERRRQLDGIPHFSERAAA